MLGLRDRRTSLYDAICLSITVVTSVKDLMGAGGMVPDEQCECIGFWVGSWDHPCFLEYDFLEYDLRRWETELQANYVQIQG
jgi:hypothetical protein